MIHARTARLVAWTWYRGGAFLGWQSQPGGGTVQQHVETVLAALQLRGRPTAAGRTDKGVHARMQVLRFPREAGWTPSALAQALRERLGPDAGVACVKEARDDFHPAWSSQGKEYRYRLWRGAATDAPHGCWRLAESPKLASARLTPEAMGTVLARAVGTRDFSALHSGERSREVRTLSSVETAVLPDGRWEVRLRGDGFGRHQVRVMVGTAALVAAGLVPESQWEAAVDKAAPIRGLRAPAEGLVLWEVLYPPALDPFSPEERREAEGVPRAAPFR
jgi:tRNA pseudouridine38-40 synthase